MRKAKKKSFNWYGMKQHFSIRKYHFGAASVLLGMSLVMGAGAQTVKAEETAASSDATTASSTSVDSLNADAKESVALPTETAASSERTVDISYIVKYVLEDGSVVSASVESVSTTTTEAIAKATATVTAVVPEGYELASGESATVLHEVTENAENIVTVKVVKKVEATATVSTPTTTSTTVATASSTTTAATSTTPTTPATVEEAKTVLEQVTSEAEVLANEANRLVAADSTNEALKTAVAATKLAATEATAVLNDSAATLESVNAQINAVRSNVEALALELRKFLGSDVIEVALNTSVTSGLKVGEGEGILVEKGTTATPSMDDPNGAGIKPHTLRTGVTATTEAGWYTFDSYDLNSYNVNMAGSIFNGTALNAYIRFSLDSNPNTQTVLAELVSKTDGQVLEKHTVETDTSVVFTYPKTINANNENIKLSYETQNAVDGSTYGNLRFIGDTTGSIYNNTILPVYQINTTTYKVEDGRILATYNLQTIGGQTVTSSGQREFAGYEFVEKIVEPAQGGYPVGTVYVAGKVNTATDKSNTIQYKVIRTIVSNTEYVHEIYVLDPTYTGTVDWDGLDTRGFFKLLETSHLSYTPDRVSYDYNTNATISANYTVDPDSGYMVFAESPLNAKGSKYRVVAQWSGTDATGPYGRIFIGSQVWTKANTGADTPFAWQSVNGSYIDLGYAPYGIQQTLRGASTPAALTTTYVYRALNQEAIIRYQVEGATDYLEDSGILTGGSGTDINYSTEETINKYKKLGYELVSDNFTTSGGQDYDSDTAVLQEFLVVIKPRVVDVPKGVVPGEPVDPTDPNSPVWPDTVKNQETTQEVTRTVEYKYEDGTPVRVDASGNILPKDSTEGTPLVKTQTVTFTRPAQVNLVTGEVTYGEWSADSTDVLSGNLIPEITDYTATRTTLEGADAPMTETVTDKTVAATDADINEVVYFKENPKYGDVVVNYVNTDGKVIATPVVDTNDALVGTDYSTADRVPEKIVEDTTGDVYYYKEIKAEDAAKETGKVVEGTTEVTYVYEKAGNVVVNYTLADGTVIKDPVNDETNAKPGSPYDTKDNKPETITTTDGKVYKLVPAATIGNETGDVEAGKTTEVTYIYEEVVSDVVVEYYDTEGNVIAKTVTDTDDASVGTVYNTDEDNRPATITTDDGTVYYYKEVKDTSAPTTGKVAETTTTVQYVYEKAGNVVVNYITEDGTVIKQPVNDETNAQPGTSYDTTDNKPTTITTDDGKTYELIPTATVGTENGTVEAGKTTEVTYVYKEVKGSVVVNYVTTDGTVLQAPVTDTPETSTGTAYDTTDVKPTEITTADGKTYRLVPALTVGNENGTVVAGVTEITYVYEEVKGDVVVNYVNTDGKVIATPVVDTKATSTGTAYDTTDNKPEKIIEDATGDVYYYKEVQTGSNETGKVVEGTTEVTYVYEKAGNVVVNYITEDGTVIKTPVNDETNAKPGSPYDTTDNKPKTITTEDGTTYELVRTDGNENGSVEGGKTTEVTYVYRKVEAPVAKTGNVVVEYYNTDGEKIAADVEDTPETAVGTVYETLDYKPTTITKDGVKYYYKEVKATSATEKGTVSEGTTTVQYVYEPGGSVTVNYVTTDGAVIKSPVKDEENAEPGKSYTTEDNKPTTITTEDGKTYKLVPNATTGDENGTITSGEDKQVTYVYEEVKGNVVVNYIDTEGNVIKTPVEDTKSASTGTAYDTTDNKPTTITTEDGTVYEIVPVLTIGSESGSVVEGTTQVTYVYRKVSTPTPAVKNGTVVVNYVTEDGTVIKSPVTDTPTSPEGTSYDTTDNKPTEITTEDGSRYVLIPSKTIGSENGTVVEGETVVTYVYKKVANWIPEIPSTPENPTPVNPVIPYPFDPTNPDKPVDPTTPGTNGEVPNIPYVPGYTPVDPKDNTPLKPVDPNDPGKGYVPPTPDETGKDTPIPYVQNGNVVVNYVTEDGTVIKSPVNDETDAPAGKSYDTTDNKPTEIVTEDGSRYVLIPSKTIGTENGTVEGGKTTEITYVYKKVANWIPEIPGVPENERPVVPYPFDPNNPDVPVTPNPGTVIPNVPGYTPVDPKDNTPLKPVDPNDPGKGYVPPTPDETGKDTPIPYVQNGNVVVNYVTEDGTVIKSPVNDETDAPAGKSYDTTDNKPTTITTEDGTTYELVRVDGSENGTVVGGKTTEVTYVYRKVETPTKKVVTNHVDEEGNPIAPQEEGTTPDKSIPGYEFTGKTITDEDGNTTHIYKKTPTKKVVTNHVDEEGNPIAPQEEGTTPDKSIPGYEFTGKTITDEDGNTTHIYKKTPTKKVVTNHVDEEGNPVAPQEDGTTPNKSIPGYEYVRTVVDVEGNTTHIYRKVSNKPTPPATETPVKPQPTTPTPTADKAKQLPNTGEASSSAGVLGAAMLVAAIALAGKRRRNED
ncbi:MucBP domain-containing protein [Streptococcus suis]|uniref:MucBP domain-containing protein n=1 Tax=Streptococcus suis TaxID=1307 RepID=UPI00345B69FE